MGFRAKRGVDLPEDEQAYIWAVSRLYRKLGRTEREKIRTLCEKSAGEYSRALLEFVTTDQTATAICLKHSISRATLYRCVQRYYEGFAEGLPVGQW